MGEAHIQESCQVQGYGWGEVRVCVGQGQVQDQLQSRGHVRARAVGSVYGTVSVCSEPAVAFD